MVFPVVIHEENNSFGATVPDLPGCFSAGETIKETLENVQEAVLCHIEGLFLDHQNIPLGLPVEQHQKNKDFQDGIWAVVNIDLSQLSNKAKRVNITIPERILVQVDQFANKKGESRSGLLVSAVLDYMNKEV